MGSRPRVSYVFRKVTSDLVHGWVRDKCQLDYASFQWGCNLATPL